MALLVRGMGSKTMSRTYIGGAHRFGQRLEPIDSVARSVVGARVSAVASVVVPPLLMVAFPALDSYVDQLWHIVPPRPAVLYAAEAAVCGGFGALLAGHIFILARHHGAYRACALAWVSFVVAAAIAAALTLGIYRISAVDMPFPYEIHFQMSALAAYFVQAVSLSVSAWRAGQRPSTKR